MKYIRSLIIGLGLVVTCGGSAWAWNDLGHITVAQIAFRQLSASERQAVVQILSQHPHIDTYFKKPAGLDIPDDEWLFLRAATWCDYVRPPKGFDRDLIPTHSIYKFHRGPWHYINYPYQAGQTVGPQLPVPLTPSEGEDTDAVRQLSLTRDVLKGTLADDPGLATGVTAAQNKAVRLCWLFHLTGDLHQPLHATALVNSQLFPGPNHGDAGGNFIVVRTSTTSKPVNLHSYWDGVLGYASGWRDGNNVQKLTADVQRCRTLAELLTHAALAPEMLPELQQHPKFVDWADESYRQAVSVAYDGGQLQFAVKKDVDENRVAEDDVPLLPPLLQEKARATANKRVALAGYRLANQLQAVIAP